MSSSFAIQWAYWGGHKLCWWFLFLGKILWVGGNQRGFIRVGHKVANALKFYLLCARICFVTFIFALETYRIFKCLYLLKYEYLRCQIFRKFLNKQLNNYKRFSKIKIIKRIFHTFWLTNMGKYWYFQRYSHFKYLFFKWNNCIHVLHQTSANATSNLSLETP